MLALRHAAGLLAKFVFFTAYLLMLFFILLCFKVIAFDDSFEHEVWFEADPSIRRVVLIVDIWHPDITIENRAKAPRFK